MYTVLKYTLCLFMLCGFTTIANTNGWTSNASHSTKFSEPSNWSLGHPPTPTEDVVIPTTPSFGAFFPVVDVEGINMNSLSIGNGASFNTNGFSITIAHNLSGAGTFIANTSNVNIGGNMDITNFTTGLSTINFDGTPIQFSNPYTFHNLIINSEVTMTGLANVLGDLTINGILNLGPFIYDINGNVTGTGTLIAGPGSDIKVAGNMTVGIFGANTSTITFDGNVAQNFNNYEFFNLTINTTSTVSANSDATVNGDLTITNGTLIASSSRIFDVSKNILGAGTLKADGSAVINVGKDMKVGTFIAGTSSTVGFISTDVQAVQSFNAYTFNDLKINSSSIFGVVMNGNTIVNGSVVITSGALDTGNNNLTVKGTIKGAGELVGGNGNTINVEGDFFINTFTAKTSTVNFIGTKTQSIIPAAMGAGYTFNDITSNNSSVSGVIIKTNTIVNGALSIISSKFVVDNNKNLTVLGNVSGAGTLSVKQGTTIKIGGNMTVAFLVNSASSNITFNFNGNSAQNINSYTFKILKIDNSSSSVLMKGNEVVENDLTIMNGTLSTGNNNLTVGGNISGNGTLEGGIGNTISLEGNMTVTSFTPIASIVLFNGTVAQNFNSYMFNSLSIENTAGVTMNGSATVNGIINFIQGHLITGTNILTLASTGSLSGETDNKYLKGKLTTTRNVGANASTFGNIGFQITAGSDDLGNVTVTRVSNATPFSNQNRQSIARYWDVAAGNQPTNGRDVTLTWNSADNNNPNVDLTNAIVFKSSDGGATWNSVSAAQDATGGSITATNVNSFSIFTVSDNLFSPSADVAPVLSTIEITTIKYIKQNNTSINLTDSISVEDSDDATLTGGSVLIATGFIKNEDELQFTSFSNITGNYNSTIGVLTLSGNDSKANYQTALRSVKYNNLKGLTATTSNKTINFSITDGKKVSNTLSRNLNVSSSLISPTDLTINITAKGFVRLTWKDNSTNELGFIINRNSIQNSASTAKENLIATFAAIDTVGPNITEYEDTTVQEGFSYEYGLSAYDSFGVISDSVSTSVATSKLIINPPSNLSLTTADNKSVDISWQDNSAIETGYRIERAVGTTSQFSNIGEVVSDTTSFIDSTVLGGIKYFYRVIAFKDSVTSSYSDTTSITIVLTGIDNLTSVIPKQFILNQNYPNPFNPSTNINLSVPQASFVILKVYDVLGKEVITLVNEELKAGTYNFNFDAVNLTSGVYFYRISAGKFIQTKKMLLLK